MTARLTRSATALAIVVAAYWLYALAAVPLIEPPAARRLPAKPISPSEVRQQAATISPRYVELLAAYFPSDHWAHQNPKILESKQGMLLIQDYDRLEDGRLKLTPCAMIFFPQDRADKTGPQRQAVILEAPQGAILEFEGGFDPVQAKVGKLVHGQLQGEITLRSDMREAGPRDDLKIVTRDVELTQHRIWTEHDVQFRLGESTGHGSHMEIRLLPASDSAEGKTAGMNVGGLQSFELARKVKMHLDLGEADLLPADRPDEKKPAAGQHPVEVTSKGPFHFDLVRYVATFEDQVDVVRINPSGPSDQMNCELLSVYFAPRDKPPIGEKAGPDLGPATGSLRAIEPTAIEAQGDPVMVRSPSTGGHARCQRLHYDLVTRKISLSGSDEIMLFQGPNEIHAPALHYQPGEKPGAPPTVWASGPGWLRAAREENPGQTFEARWNDELHLRRHEGVPVISVLGRPRLRVAGMGGLTANEVHLWLREPASPPSAPPQNQPQGGAVPDRLMATGDVQVDSPQLTGKTERLEAWFRQVSAPQSSAQTAPQAGGSRLVAVRPNPNQPPQSSYDIQGKLVRLQLAMRGQQADLSDVTVEGLTHFRETKTARPSDKPLEIYGDGLELSGLDSETTHVTVRGRPGRVNARGMSLEGAAIELDRRVSRLWIDGAGKMSLPVGGDGRGQVAAGEPALSVAWQGKMEFDGATMRCERSVVAERDQQILRTEILEVEMSKRISFGRSLESERPQVKQIACRDGVFLQNRSFENAEPKSIDRMQAKNLTIHQESGKLDAEGPGWVTSVRVGGSNPLVVPASAPAPAAPKDKRRLEYLRADFARAIEGNIHQRWIALVGEVRTVYGPVPNWEAVVDADNPEGLGESGVLVHCDRLTVTEVPASGQARGTIELEAREGVVVEGRSFTARAERIAYAQAKDLLVLEGSGRSDAQLWRQTTVGAPSSHAAARKILYWRSANRIEVDDARFLDLNQFNQAKPGGQR